MERLEDVKNSHYHVPDFFFRDGETIGSKPKDSTILKGVLGKYGRSTFNPIFTYFLKEKKGLKIDHSYITNEIGEAVYTRKFKYIEKFLKYKTSKFQDYCFKKEVEKKGPLVISSRIKFEGMIPLKPGSLTQHVYNADRVCIDFAMNSEKFEHIINSTKSAYKYYLSGGWMTVREDVKGYSKKIKNRMTFKDMENILIKYEKFFKIPDLPKPKKEEIKNSYVNPVANSGFLTSLLSGHIKKDSGSFSNHLAEKLYDITRQKRVIDTSLKTFGGRERLVDSREKQGEIGRSRAVIREEGCVSQLNHLYARRVTDFTKYKNKKWELSHGIGGQLHGMGWHGFKKRFNKRGTKVLTFDWSRHDQNVSEKTLIFSYSILRAFFNKESKTICNHFFFFLSGHLKKNVVTPEGIIYSIYEGIQSGNAFTSHVTTIACMLETLYSLDILGIEVLDIVCYGDDVMVLVRNDLILPSDFKNKVFKLVGIKIKDVELDYFQPKSRLSRCSFLQVFNYNGYAARDTQRIVDKILYPLPRSTKGYIGRINMVKNMLNMTTGGRDPTNMLEDYLRYLCELCQIPGDFLVAECRARSAKLEFDIFRNDGNEYYYGDNSIIGKDRYYPPYYEKLSEREKITLASKSLKFIFGANM